MSSEGVRVSFDLADLMNLGLVHRRLWTLAHSGGFVAPKDIEGLALVMDKVFGDDAEALRLMINEQRRKGHGPTA